MGNCKCGAGPRSDGGWFCGSYVKEPDGTLVESGHCLRVQQGLATAENENLNEFRRGVATVYHRWTTGELNADGAVNEVAKLLIAIPEG